MVTRSVTGMKASPWSKEATGVSQSEHLRKLGRLITPSGGFWGAGLLWHGVESGPAGALQIIAGHGAVALEISGAAKELLLSLQRILARIPGNMCPSEILIGLLRALMVMIQLLMIGLVLMFPAIVIWLTRAVLGS